MSESLAFARNTCDKHLCTHKQPAGEESATSAPNANFQASARSTYPASTHDQKDFDSEYAGAHLKPTAHAVLTRTDKHINVAEMQAHAPTNARSACDEHLCTHQPSVEEKPAGNTSQANFQKCLGTQCLEGASTGSHAELPMSTSTAHSHTNATSTEVHALAAHDVHPRTLEHQREQQAEDQSTKDECRDSQSATATLADSEGSSLGTEQAQHSAPPHAQHPMPRNRPPFSERIAKHPSCGLLGTQVPKETRSHVAPISQPAARYEESLAPLLTQQVGATAQFVRKNK